MKLLLLNGGNNPIQRAKRAHEMLSILGGIFKSQSRGQAFAYLLENGAATAWTLQVDLNLAEATAYRAIKDLRRLGYLEEGIRISIPGGTKGGPRPIVWVMPGAEPDDVVRAINKHNRALSPMYRMIEEITQELLDNYIIPKRMNGIDYKYILLHMRKETNLIGRPLIDAANMATVVLRAKDVKVWR